MAGYFEIIIRRYDINYILRQQQIFEREFLLKGIDDQAQEVRKQVRICWKTYKEIPEFACRINVMLMELRSSAKKQLMQELFDAPNQNDSINLSVGIPSARVRSNRSICKTSRDVHNGRSVNRGTAL